MPDAPFQLNTPVETQRLLADRMRQLRLLAGWKQSTLAERSGVSLPTVRRFERTGQTTVENLLKLCHALGRLDEFEQLLRPPAAQSLAELEARATQPSCKRGRR